MNIYTDQDLKKKIKNGYKLQRLNKTKTPQQ